MLVYLLVGVLNPCNSDTLFEVGGILPSRTDITMDDDRQDLMAILSNSQGTGYASQSGQVTGILKTMGDEMNANLAETTIAEDTQKCSDWFLLDRP